VKIKTIKAKPSKSNQMLLRDVKRKSKHLKDRAKYWDALLEHSSIMDRSNWKKEIKGWIAREDYFDFCDAVEHFCGCTLDIVEMRGEYVKVYGVGYLNATVIT
jgi:hypothetical protein